MEAEGTGAKGRQPFAAGSDLNAAGRLSGWGCLISGSCFSAEVRVKGRPEWAEE